MDGAAPSSDSERKGNVLCPKHKSLSGYQNLLLPPKKSSLPYGLGRAVPAGGPTAAPDVLVHLGLRVVPVKPHRAAGKKGLLVVFWAWRGCAEGCDGV